MSDILREYLIPIEWTPQKLRKVRKSLGLSCEEVGEVLGYSRQGIWKIEVGQTANPLIILGYGSVLENWIAYKNGFVPAYRKVGTNEIQEIKDI